MVPDSDMKVRFERWAVRVFVLGWIASERSSGLRALRCVASRAVLLWLSGAFKTGSTVGGGYGAARALGARC